MYKQHTKAVNEFWNGFSNKYYAHSLRAFVYFSGPGCEVEQICQVTELSMGVLLQDNAMSTEREF